MKVNFIKKYVPLFLIVFLVLNISNKLAYSSDNSEVVLNENVEWSPLNPARGDKSPQAGQLWGDRTKSEPSGFLVKFADGFSSPPHIHNVTYRGVVISGLVHNDDPKAANMWLPAGSFWTQPAGEAHITSAQGQHNVAYIESEDGPYLVESESEAFDNGERPVNVDKSNLVWLHAKDIDWVEADNVKISFLWSSAKDKGLNGSFIKLPKGFDGTIDSNGSDFRAIIVKGEIEYHDSIMKAGGYFGSAKSMIYDISSKNESVIYIRTNGQYKVTN